MMTPDYRCVSRRAVHTQVLFVLGMLFLFSPPAPAQCYYGSCPTPSTPPTPTISPNKSVFRPAYGQSASFQLSVPNSLAWYGYTQWSNGQRTYGDSSQVDTLSQNKGLGSYAYSAKTCYEQDNTCSSWSGGRYVYVLATPQSPSLNIGSVTACDAPIDVGWSPRSGYPSGATRYYDLQESTDGGGSWSGIHSGTTDLAWSRTTVTPGTTYHYRTRSFYTWTGGRTSYRSGWTTTSVTVPGCQPGVPGPFTIPASPSGGRVPVGWGAAGGTVTAYDLDQRYNGGGWTDVYNGPALSTTVSDLSAGQVEYRVRACRTVGGYTGCSDFRTSSVVTVGAELEVDYRYDALGRLVRVVENQSTRAGYCYDAAGNRHRVEAGGGGGEDCPSAPGPAGPPAPTGLSATWQAGPSWWIRWNAVDGATYYRLKLDDNITRSVTDTEYSSFTNDPNELPPEPVWVQACTQNDICGLTAYF